MPDINDFLQQMRFRNLFAPTQVPSPTNQPIMQQQAAPAQMPANYNAGQRMQELYNPEFTDQNNFRGAVSDMPARSNYQPGKLRQVAAAMAGLGAGVQPASMWGGVPVGMRSSPEAAYRVTRGINEAPFDAATEDWKNKIGPLGTLANREETRNKEDRINANETVTRELSDNKEKNANVVNLQKLEDARKKEADIWATKQADMQRKIDESNAKLEQAAERMKQQGENQVAVLEFHRAQLAAQDARHALDISTRERAMDETKRQHDEQQKKWDADRKVAEERIKALEDAAKLKAQPTTTTTETSTTKPTTGFLGFGAKPGTQITTKVTGKANPPTNKIKMHSPDGKDYMVDNSEVDESIKHGWAKVQ